MLHAPSIGHVISALIAQANRSWRIAPVATHSDGRQTRAQNLAPRKKFARVYQPVHGRLPELQKMFAGRMPQHPMQQQRRGRRLGNFARPQTSGGATAGADRNSCSPQSNRYRSISQITSENLVVWKRNGKCCQDGPPATPERKLLTKALRKACAKTQAQSHPPSHRLWQFALTSPPAHGLGENAVHSAPPGVNASVDFRSSNPKRPGPDNLSNRRYSGREMGNRRLRSPR